MHRRQQAAALLRWTVPFPVLWIALILLATMFQGSRGLYAPDEGYYVPIASHMLATGDYLVPRLNGLVWLDKPPFTYWGIATGLKLLGHNEWGARLAHSVAYCLTVFLVYLIGSSMRDRRTGVLGAAIFATMLLPFAAASVVTPDLPLTLWTTMAILFFWHSIKPGASSVTTWKLFMCAAFGMAFLTKGPAALLPAMAMFVYLACRRLVVRYFLKPWLIPGLLIFVATGLSWYIWISYQVPGAFDYIWNNQVVGRTISSEYLRNPGWKGVAMYGAVLLFGTFPWSLFWVQGLTRWRLLHVRVLMGDPGHLLLAAWIAVPTIILLLAQSRLPFYMIPMFPAIALATASCIPRSWAWTADHQPFILLSSPVAMLLIASFIGLISLRFAVVNLPSHKDMRALSQELSRRVPDPTLRIIPVNDHVDGVAFYDRRPIRYHTVDEKPYPFFSPTPHVRTFLANYPRSTTPALLLCRNDGIAIRLQTALERAGFRFQQIALEHGRRGFYLPGIRHDTETSFSHGAQP